MHPLQDARMRFLIYDVLRCRFVQVGMGLELEQQIKNVDEQEYNSCPAADFEDSDISSDRVTERGMKSCLERTKDKRVRRTVWLRCKLTGIRRLNTARHRRQADNWVTVLLYSCSWY